MNDLRNETTRTRLFWMMLAIGFVLLAAIPGNAEPERTAWEPLFRGIEHATGHATEPRLQAVNALRVDLHEPSIEFIATPSNGEDPGETLRRTGRRFVEEFEVQVAVNTHFIDIHANVGRNAVLHGVSVSQGELVSELEDLPHGGASLLITKDNEARFERTIPGFDLDGVWTALESWPLFIVDGQNLGDPTTRSIHPRTAIGLSEDKRYLIIITIDGRQPGYSEGATFQETAQWLIDFGAYEGMNLDGGGSTHLWIDCPDEGPRPLNTPSENRAVGSHLGIYAPPLESATDNQ